MAQIITSAVSEGIKKIVGHKERELIVMGIHPGLHFNSMFHDVVLY